MEHQNQNKFESSRIFQFCVLTRLAVVIIILIGCPSSTSVQSASVPSSSSVPPISLGPSISPGPSPSASSVLKKSGRPNSESSKFRRKTKGKLKPERWLEDFETENQINKENDYDEPMQADSPLNQVWKSSDVSKDSLTLEDDEEIKCPPPPRQLPTFSCLVNTCQSDKACAKKGLKCCYNGCRYTCMVPVQPPTYVDWVKQPQRRLVSGTSWLLEGPDETEEVEWCSTSEIYEADEEPLLCPEGYACHIEDPGDLKKEIPNRGKCVPESDAVDNQKQTIPSTDKTTFSSKCTINKRTVSNGTLIQFNTHSCQCLNGAVLCQVGRKN